MTLVHSSSLCRLAICVCSLLTGVAGAAELVLTNGRIYTADAQSSWAEAVAIDSGRFVFVGSTEDARAFAGDATLQIDLNGRFVLPGLVDSHTHPGLVARSVEYVELPWTPATKQEMFDAHIFILQVIRTLMGFFKYLF